MATATKKAAKTADKKPKGRKAKPVDPKRLAKAQEVLDKLDEQEESEEGGGKIREILALFVKGFTPKEIIACGYNRTTVYRQTNDFKKLQQAPALEYYGYKLFEARVQGYMNAKKVSREEAVKALTKKDIEG